MPKVFRSRVGPEGFQKGYGRVPEHPEGMPKVVNSQCLPSGTLREPFAVLVETRLYTKAFSLDVDIILTNQV